MLCATMPTTSAAAPRQVLLFSGHLIGETGHVVDPFEALALLGQAYLRFAPGAPDADAVRRVIDRAQAFMARPVN